MASKTTLLLEQIKSYGLVLTKENHLEEILEWFEVNDAITVHKDYIMDYIYTNKNKLDFYWSLYMVLLSLSIEQDVYCEYEKYIINLSKYPENMYVKFCEAYYHFRHKGDVLSAVILFESMDSIYVDNIEVLHELGYCYYLCGLFKESYKTYLRLEKITSERPEYNKLRGKALLNMGIHAKQYLNDRSEAIKFIRKAVKVNPEYEQAKVVLEYMERDNLLWATLKKMKNMKKN